MFLDFFLLLRNNGIPVSITEYLFLLESLKKKVVWGSTEDFYYLCRLSWVKDEKHLDIFDRLFGMYFQGMEYIPEESFYQIPEHWLHNKGARIFSAEEMEQIKAIGGLDKLLQRIEELLLEQKERHSGGGKWIGTGGTSPFGAYGYNPEGIRIGQHESRHQRAVKVWDERQYSNLREDAALESRNMKMALRRLRRMTREGGAKALDMEETIRKTSDNAGLLQLEYQLVKKNNARVLLLLDSGGSMDDHVELCSQLFQAARYEFRHLEFFYFHNCVYEKLWKDNHRRRSEYITTMDVLNTFGKNYYVIFVGDASMSPYELLLQYGSVEHYNEEAGVVWLNRFKSKFPACVWLNPVKETYWQHTKSISIVKEIMSQRMFPLTIDGITQAISTLMKKRVV